MPLAKKTGPSVLPESLQTQISENFKKDSDKVTELQNINSETASSKAKSKYADSVNLRLTSGKRNEFKKFFTDCEISMNQGFEMAVDYVIREMKAGKITVSKSGINKISE